MIIDTHTHILSAGDYPGFERFTKELCCGYFQNIGKLPSNRVPATEDWKGLEYLWLPVDPKVSIKEHPGCDKVVILGVAPSTYTAYDIRGTIDTTGLTDVPGPPSIEKGNDYIASMIRRFPDKLIGFCAVNPKHKGVKSAVKELERSIEQLKLTGLKLYPMYDHYSPDDRELAFPIFEKAEELDIPVIVHQSMTGGVWDAPLKYGMPYLLDDVGREFKKLRLTIAHIGVPWVEEAIAVMSRYPNFHADLSYFSSIASREEAFRTLWKCKKYGVPLDRLFWATDYPCFETPESLLNKFKTVNEEAPRLGLPEFSEKEIRGVLGDNFARMIGIEE